MAKAKKGARSSRRRKVTDKADTAEVRTAATQKPLIKADRLLHHINTIKGYNDKIATLVAHRRNAMNAIKADRIIPTVVTDLIKLERGDPLEYREFLEQMGVGLKACGHQFQLSVFDTAYGSPEEQAKAEARAAAQAGRSPECQAPEGSPAFEAYMQEYHSVQATMVPGAKKLSAAELKEASTPRKQTETVQ